MGIWPPHCCCVAFKAQNDAAGRVCNHLSTSGGLPRLATCLELLTDHTCLIKTTSKSCHERAHGGAEGIWRDATVDCGDKIHIKLNITAIDKIRNKCMKYTQIHFVFPQIHLNWRLDLASRLRYSRLDSKQYIRALLKKCLGIGT